jgi:hypothetical protein
MDQEVFKSWLIAYGAWEARDPQASAALFEQGGTYQVTPFLEPMRGRPAILEYWTGVAATQRDISFGFDVLAVTADVGIARWWASFIRIPPGLQTKLDGIFVITLTSEGRCSALREWWHKDQ